MSFGTRVRTYRPPADIALETTPKCLRCSAVEVHSALTIRPSPRPNMLVRASSIKMSAEIASVAHSNEITRHI